ncbi:unnamed protein product [Clonostachys rosea f. rosea IK726]|uniref:Uncharacterized protein n=1 Tax=Clonostachys rosea f. rosea IK726 TaxID=1349383 RepID=A0ACA9THA8_BIOOC|nr:unnamed protein product [Clonostachys rosea f. rosea IK726]
MVKIALAPATSQLSKEILDSLVATGKHEIIGLVRKDPSTLPQYPGVTWVQTDFQDEAELVKSLSGVHTVLSFIAVHLDPGNESQKRLIDASIKAGVNRFAPSEWSSGVKLESFPDTLSWYAGKLEVKNYLESINKDKKVIEYCRFQPGGFLNYLAHPHSISKHITTIPLTVNIEKRHALLEEGSLDAYMTFTTTKDIANVVARAVEYEGEWPKVGGIQGNRHTLQELVEIGEKVRGTPFTKEWLKSEDLDAGLLKTENYTRLDLPSTPPDQIDAFSKVAAIGVLRAISRGVWDVSDEWNKIFPDYEFAKTDEILQGLWKGQ